LVTALSRLLTPLKFSGSDGGAAASVWAAVVRGAATSGLAVEDERGMRRAPRIGEAEAEAALADAAWARRAA
jgi:hypothetical protein